jgi:AraC-like DNA-binding protein
VARGNFVIIKPYETHITANYGKSGYDRFLISFRKSFIKNIAQSIEDFDIFRCFDDGFQVITLDFAKQSLIESLLFSMLDEYGKKENGYEAFLKTALIQLLLILSRNPEATPESSMKAIHKTVSAAVNYINEHYREDITLAQISKKYFVSQSHFSRTFKRVTGIPFVKYLNGVRIKAAQQLLREGNLSIGRVAEMVGYSGTTHFGRIFKDITGISPYEYKRTKGKKQ